MSAYLIADVEVQSPEAYLEYVRRNTPLVQQHGGKFIVRGGKCRVLEGSYAAHRVVIIEFPDVEAANAWYDSPEYQEVRKIRQRTSRAHVIAIIEGA